MHPHSKLHCRFARLFLTRAALVFTALATASVAAQGPPPTTVKVTPIVERDVSASLRLVGTIRPEREALVASEVSGVVVELKADDGTFVRRGEVICRLDDSLARLRADEARGRLASLEAELAELENGTRPEELRRAEAAALEAKAMLDKWEFERGRVKQLDQEGRSNPKEVHDTEMEYWAAERRYGQAQAMLDMAKTGPRQEQRDRARADVKSQEAVVKRLERDLEKTRIPAPFDGFVAAKRTELGEWIDEGGPVCELVALETVRLRTDVPEAAIAFAAVGALATFDVEALGVTDSQPIARVIPRATTTARTFPVEIDIPNRDHRLLPGMFVWVSVPSGAPGKRLMVTKDAIVPRGREKTLFIVRPGERGLAAMQVPVETGLETNGEIEVRGPGLQAGDQAVARANERLFPFAPVVVAPAGPASQPAVASDGAAGSGAADGSSRSGGG